MSGGATYLWTSTDPVQPRLLWAPRVHDVYQERCSIFLLRVQRAGTTGTISGDFRNLLIANQINSATVHATFGEDDLIVRMWATVQARQRFLRAVEEARDRIQIQTMREFVASEVHYRENAPSELSSTHLSDEDKRHVVAESRRAKQEPDQPVPEGTASYLLRHHLAIEAPSASGVKFYTFLRANQTGVNIERVVLDLFNAVREGNIQAWSIYAGSGFCDIVLKGVVDEYELLLPAVNTVRRVARKHNMTPWTQPVADLGQAPLAESLDAIDGELPAQFEEIIALGGLKGTEIRRELGSLAKVQGSRLNTLLEELLELDSPAAMQRIRQIVGDILLRDIDSLDEHMGVLVKIERDLRYFLPRFLGRRLGNDWKHRLESDGLVAANPTNSTGSIAPGVNQEKWSLDGMLSALVFAHKRYPGPLSADLDRIFPEGWKSRVQDIKDARDAYAHGHFADQAWGKDFSGPLVSSLRKTYYAFMVGDSLSKAVADIKQSRYS